MFRRLLVTDVFAKRLRDKDLSAVATKLVAGQPMVDNMPEHVSSGGTAVLAHCTVGHVLLVVVRDADGTLSDHLLDKT